VYDFGNTDEQPVDIMIWRSRATPGPFETKFAEIWAPPGCKVDRSRGNGGYDEHIDVSFLAAHSVTVFERYIRVTVDALPQGPDDPPASAHFVARYVVYWMSEQPRYESATVADVRAFATGRQLEGCLAREDDGFVAQEPQVPPMRVPFDYVTFETALPQRMWAGAVTRVADAQDRVVRANALGRELKQLMVNSVNSASRYPVGEHSLLETDLTAQFLLDGLQGAAEPRPADTRVIVPDVIAEGLDRGARDQLGRLTVDELIATPTTDLAGRLAVSPLVIQTLKLVQLGVPVGGHPPREPAADDRGARD
jgi:hypothetical protein